MIRESLLGEEDEEDADRGEGKHDTGKRGYNPVRFASARPDWGSLLRIHS